LTFLSIKGYLRSFAISRGYSFSKHALAPNPTNSAAYFYNLDYSHTHITRIPIDNNLLTYRGRSIKEISADPYLSALASASSLKNKRMFINEFVRTISSFVSPGRTAADALQLPLRRDLQVLPEWCSVLPWELLSVEQWRSMLISSYYSKRLNLFARYLTSPEKINPYAIEFWQSHARQFYAISSLIAKHGFYDHSLPVVNVLLKDGAFKLMMSCSGNHRLMSASILGLTEVPVRIGNIIDLARISYWTNVQNGYYTIPEANKIFLDYFSMAGYGSYI